MILAKMLNWLCINLLFFQCFVEAFKTLSDFRIIDIYIKNKIENETFKNNTINFKELSEGIKFLSTFIESEDAFYCNEVKVWLYVGDFHVYPSENYLIDLKNKSLSLLSWQGEDEERENYAENSGQLIKAKIEWNNNYFDSKCFYFVNGENLTFYGLKLFLQQILENPYDSYLIYNNFTKFSLFKSELSLTKNSSFYLIIFFLSNKYVEISNFTVTDIL